MIVGVPVETNPEERRVAVVPSVAADLAKAGLEVLVQQGAGQKAGFPDEAYQKVDARLASDRSELFSSADIILQVNPFNAHPGGGDDLELLRQGQIVLGLLNPLGDPETAQQLARKGVTAFALELLPRISRAQPMDALTSMSTIAGYKAVLVAASELNKMYPLMMTAAGTIRPARVLVIGAGVAGLQAIATAHRLGAVVQAYDVRPAVREQVESLGAKFVDLGLETEGSEGTGGYAQAMDEEFYKRQRDMMSKLVAENDVVITTAVVAGRKAPLLISEEGVQGMHTGSVILDLAAEGGGNCELTKPGEKVEYNGITILAPTDLPSSVAHHASQMYARNVAAFLLNLVKEGELHLNLEDEIIRDTLLVHQGEVVHPQVQELLAQSAPAQEERRDS